MFTTHLKNFLNKNILLDERDLSFVWQILRTFLFLLPLSIAIFLYSKNHPLPFWINLIYLALVVFLLGPHLLMLHNICHRNPWRKSARPLLSTLVSLQGLLFGLPPMLYYYHHIKMHHREGNGIKDLSSTEKYQRDSFLHWLIYFIRFVFLNFLELPRYFIQQKKWTYAFKSLLGHALFFSLIFFAYRFNPSGTWAILLLPTAICWFGLMAGNWTQHAFIDWNDPESPYKNSITLIDSLYNKRCFNDGYHIGHHFFPGMHWSEMPENFEQNKSQYYKNGALVFRTLDYQAIWFLLMLKRYHFLAKFYVPEANSQKSSEEIVQLIKNRMLKASDKILLKPH